MTDHRQELPDHVHRHLAEVLKSSGLPETEESYKKLASAWLQKRRLFEEQTRLLDMETVPALPNDSPRGALILTLSGSLISLGRRKEGAAGSARRAEYASIELRRNVPRLAVTEAARLARDVVRDQPLEFESGPVRATSAVLDIAVCGEGVSAEEEERRIREATIFLTNGFTRINRTVLAREGELPERFTTQDMIRTIASRHGLSLRQTRRVVEDYLDMLEAGMLLGERVPLGRIGRLYLRPQPARKARMGINPTTGQRILIPARPQAYLPRISFSSTVKARAAAAPIDAPEAAGGAPDDGPDQK
jgi:nucleoid DNA-binding protein